MKFDLFSSDVKNVFETEEKVLGFSQLMFETATDNLEGISQAEANRKIREKFHQILGTDEKSTRKEMRKAIRRHKTDIFEVIEETVENLLQTGWGNNPFFQEFVEIRNLAIGDENDFYVPDESVLTVAEVSGNHHNLFRQKLGAGSSFKVKTYWFGCSVYAEYELFMANRVNFPELVQKIFTSFDKKLNSLVYGSLMSAATKLPAQAQFNKSSALTADTKATLITLVEDVEAASGYEAVIMGSRTALSKLMGLSDATWISEADKVERRSTGLVGIWEGIKLVVIPQVFADGDTSTKLIDNTKLLIMPLADNKFIKVVNEGEAQVKEISDGDTNYDKTIEYEYQQKMGVNVIVNMIWGNVDYSVIFTEVLVTKNKNYLGVGMAYA